VKYDMTSPCPRCPFRTDITPYLTPGRVREITTALLRQNATFTCHKTTVAGEEAEDGTHDMVDGPNARHCAGALIMIEKMGYAHQMMRIAERLGMYDASRLNMDAPVYESDIDMLRATRKARR
jgi:hypothetical protein